MKKYDVAALGEIQIDYIYAGKSDKNKMLFEQNPGGAPANVLAAVSRLGGRTALIGKVGKDKHADFLMQNMKKYMIETEGIVISENSFTSLNFDYGNKIGTGETIHGAGISLSADDINIDLIADSSIFHIGSGLLQNELSRNAVMSALKFAGEKHITVSYAPDYKGFSDEDIKKASGVMSSVLKYVDILKITDAEIAVLTHYDNEIDASKHLMTEYKIDCCIVTMGKDGALVRTRDGYIYSDIFDTKIVDEDGADDAFLGAFLYKLGNRKPSDITTTDTKDMARFANAAAMLCASQRGTLSAMPDKLKVSELINKS